MSTDIFVGGLASLVLAAVIIVLLTTTTQGKHPGMYDKRSDNDRNSKSDR